MGKKHITIFLLMLFACQLFAEPTTENLSATLTELRRNMKHDYQQMAETRSDLSKNYEEQHQLMVNIMKQCNELSLRLYSQKQEFTFDLSYTLEKVKKEFNEFERDKMPYERIVSNLDLEIDRYARLIEALRRLPPEIDTIYGLHDSLYYRNDSLEQHHLLNASQLERTIEEATLSDSLARPFVLDEQGQQNRDSCIFYAKELMQMFFESKAIVVADSIHYNETYMRLKESYDYASNYYKLLQRRIFIEGQTPWPTILSNFDYYWEEAKEDTKEKYGLYDLEGNSKDTIENNPSLDSLGLPPIDSLSLGAIDTLAAPISDSLAMVNAGLEALGSGAFKRFEYSMQIIILLFLFAELLLIWLLIWLLLLPIYKWIKPVRRVVAKEQKRYIALLLAIIITIFLNSEENGSDTIFAKAISLANTFLWLLSAIVASMLIRVKPDQLKTSIKLYRPVIFLAIFVISCRVLFIPNSMMNIIFPPFLIFFFIWQLLSCWRRAKKADQRDRIFSWISLAVTGLSMLIAIAGYIFASLLILVWWYFQMAAILTMLTIWYLIIKYKEKRMNPRISDYLARLTKVTGQDKKTFLFKVTWFYDLVREVVLPILMITSFPLSLHWAMDVFDFDDLYENLMYNPFVQFTNDNGISTFRISVHSILLLVNLFFIFRYANNAIHSIWQQSRYNQYLRKTKRETIHKDEINLSLGNSIISFIVWTIYAAVTILTLHIPTGSLSLVAGGFSAGVGLALKDIINNFIYGIQLMSGRLKVGDWIECDGIRGRVSNINYQTTQVETINNTTVSFLNASLFAKNFTNLTKGNPYEFLKIIVGVAYGTDIQRVREVLENALQVMCTKDALGRDIVDPQRGVYVRVGDFGDSSVNIAVKQYILASERIAYIDKAKEVIYNALNENGITIPFPQRDIHVISVPVGKEADSEVE